MLKRIFCFVLVFKINLKNKKNEKKNEFTNQFYNCDELPKCDCTDLNVDLIIFELILQ